MQDRPDQPPPQRAEGRKEQPAPDLRDHPGAHDGDAGRARAAFDQAVPDAAPLESAGDAAALAGPAHRRDPWAHRRGEPRIFAFLWTVYLFIATLIAFMAVLAGPSIAPEVMRPAARLLLLLTAGGMVLLWPMARLSQDPDPHPLGGAMQDLLVIIIPAQALIWPQMLWWLARWPFDTVLALSLSMLVWGLLTAGLLALAQAGGARLDARAAVDEEAAPQDARGGLLGNAGWMVLFVILAAGGLLASVLEHLAMLRSELSSRPLNVGLMLSPLGSVLELTRDVSWTGRSTPNPHSGGHWALIGLVGAAAAVAWAAAAARGQRSQRGLRFSQES
jgi:hypothetical protein